jgi:hypothetical protein
MARKETKETMILAIFILSEIALATMFFSFIPSYVLGEVGENATAITYLEVGKVYPEILNMSIEDYQSSVTLTANSTKVVRCIGVLRDFDGDDDLTNVYAEFFHNTGGSFSDADDNNTHYTNSSCNISYDFNSYLEHTDDIYLALANCSYQVEYYTDPGIWNCTMVVNDTMNWTDTSSDTITINELLAVGLPSTMNYGLVNATYVSDENSTTVINYGNVALNLTLSGYAVIEGDGYAMNCTQGNIKNITVENIKYNLTTPNAGAISLSETQDFYLNLSQDPVVKKYLLDYNQNDTENDAQNSTYWRIYVPTGVAGSCTGNIVFGATQAGES